MCVFVLISWCVCVCVYVCVCVCMCVCVCGLVCVFHLDIDGAVLRVTVLIVQVEVDLKKIMCIMYV